MRVRLLGAVALLGICAGSLQAQPLVSSGLVVYYDFEDAFTGDIINDESGNSLNGAILSGVSRDTGTPKRGTGAGFFEPEPTGDPPVNGAAVVDITSNKANVPNFSSLIPQNEFSFSAWVNVPTTDGDKSVLQVRSGDGSFVTHMQLNNGGNLRFTTRGQIQDASAPNGGNLVNKTIPVDGEGGSEQYPVDEWFHFGGTYSVSDGEYRIYYNGEVILDGTPDFIGPMGDWEGCDGETAGEPPSRCEVGDIPSGALIGAVSDGAGRRYTGLMDEFYVFNRAISDAEMKSLFNLTQNTDPCDLNGDRNFDAADAGIMFGNWGNAGIGDCTADGVVDAADAGSLFSKWTGDPTAGPGTAAAEYNVVTGEIKVAINDVVNWYIQSASNGLTGTPVGDLPGPGLVTDNNSRIGETALGKFAYNASLGNAAAAGLSDGDLTIYWNSDLGQPLRSAPVPSVPEPTGMLVLSLGLLGLASARRCSK